jgi:hypothetical protein
MSGAGYSSGVRTLLLVENARRPMSIATGLGLQPHELTQDAGSSGGAGSSFATWTSTVPLIGRVTAFVDSSQTLQPWGPNVELDPAFTDLQPEPAPLLGRADFFQSSRSGSDEDATAPTFTLTEK